MVPTECIKVLFNAIIEPLQKLEEVEKNFQKSTEKQTPTISVGMWFETFQTTLKQYVSSLPFNLIINFGEYPEMLDQLDKGILDLIITPKKGLSPHIEHEGSSSEQIVLVGGRDVDIYETVHRTKNKLKLEECNGKKATSYMVPGNHDVSNTIGYYAKMNPISDFKHPDENKLADPKGVINLIRHILPYFKKQKYGKIINISLVMGRSTALPLGSLYNMSKFALEGFTKGFFLN
ncbi:SDR family NAD(P)-dependent oxidoreductase [Chryseobacterium sp. Mn2064]|uniref:SDR family NAD(P)-dependent oxidoreductase n=1 Tax=Chryseobacterium sp. Mn2064 TaxID=3395263 RepID=UPI003BD4E64D